MSDPLCHICTRLFPFHLKKKIDHVGSALKDINTCYPRINTLQGQVLQHLEVVLGATGGLKTLAFPW